MQKRERRRINTLERLESRLPLSVNVVINEIHYDPPNKTELSEYVELYNNSATPVDLSNWAISDAITFRFPSDTSLDPGDYVVIAQDPATIASQFGVNALGPWNGQLKNSGERIQLRDPNGNLVDEVEYRRGFPWPTVGDAPGRSIELLHPDLDNQLGGSWRAAATNDASKNRPALARRSNWKYFPGTTEPSDPRTAWRQSEFDDSDWLIGQAPIGYGDPHVNTTLSMKGEYSTVFLRKEFVVDQIDAAGELELLAQYDDGFHLWINGIRVLRENASSTVYDRTASNALENLQFVQFDLGPADQHLELGKNVIAVQLQNASLNGSSDAWFDAELSIKSHGEQSPGNINTVFANHTPPAIRQVDHGDTSISSNQQVIVTAKVTDPEGVAAVNLQYQVVRPGDYFGRYLKSADHGSPILNPRYDDPAEWINVTMRDDGLSGDSQANDDRYAATIPASVQQHRHLIRYRLSAVDSLGNDVAVPYADDPQHNFAYFVYDDVPDWAASTRPGRTPEQVYPLSEFTSIATYHLLTTQADHEDSQHIPNSTTSRYGGSEYLWPGTMVYEGRVYDNIRYRARGGVWRYAMGKNMWKFDFNRGHAFEAKDDYGRDYNEAWDKLNFSALIQQGDYLHRGEQGLFESVGFKLFNLAGVESPHTHYVHFRVVDTEDEVTADQFSGDFQGLYLAIEQPDGRMLEEHGLPDGNLYKIEGHRGDSNNQGPTQVADGSDVAQFISAYRNGNPSELWWRENLDLERYYGYRTIVEGIHHYDIAYGKNYFYYHNPETGKFQVHPWDLDLTWADNMFGNGEHDFVRKVARNSAFRTDYQNRIRELRDLLFNAEQTGMLIDEFASFVHSPGELSWVDADRAMWDHNPILRSSHVNTSKAGTGRFYQQAEPKDFMGMAQLMKDYVERRSGTLDRLMRLTERDAPLTPKLAYSGATNYAIDGLSFQTSPFADSDDAEFQAMEWRIAEVTDPLDFVFGLAPPKYEINATWESGELSEFGSTQTFEDADLNVDSVYRARVRMQNTKGIWSHWSAPIQFVAGESQSHLFASLRISEIHYHPARPTPEESAKGFADADDFEFIELVNVGSLPIDLDKAALRKIAHNGEVEGVEFDFGSESLLPGERVLVVEDIEAFEFRYGDDLFVAGQWSGKLGNGGEHIQLIANGKVVHAFSYDDNWYSTTDGVGYSLEFIDPTLQDLSQWQDQNAWRPSEILGGSPGIGTTAERVPGDFNSDGVVDFTDFLILSANFGKAGSLEDGDADKDGRISFTDLLVLSANFNQHIATHA